MRTHRARGLLNGSWQHPILDEKPVSVTITEQRRAQLTVARHAQSTEDCALLLDMLGIGGVE